jgi:hypothetical protein
MRSSSLLRLATKVTQRNAIMIRSLSTIARQSRAVTVFTRAPQFRAYSFEKEEQPERRERETLTPEIARCRVIVQNLESSIAWYNLKEFFERMLIYRLY